MKKSKRLLMLLGISFLITSCKDEPKSDICVYLGKGDVHCIPINQPGSDEYDRRIEVGDIVIDTTSFSAMKKHHKDLHDMCDNK